MDLRIKAVDNKVVPMKAEIYYFITFLAITVWLRREVR